MSSGATPAAPWSLQRKCACGGTPGFDGDCSECRGKRLQRASRGASDALAPPLVHAVLGSAGELLAPSVRAEMEARFAAYGGGTAIRPARAGRQHALEVGPENDAFEQDAARIATAVSAGAAPEQPDRATFSRSEHRTEKQRLTKEVALCPKTSPHSAGGSFSDVPPHGKTLARGVDFSRVRVHADARAAQSARAVNALAYTVGPHIVFESGRYTPETRAGRELLAHELTHTLQQGVGANTVQRDAATFRVEGLAPERGGDPNSVFFDRDAPAEGMSPPESVIDSAEAEKVRVFARKRRSAMVWTRSRCTVSPRKRAERRTIVR